MSIIFHVWLLIINTIHWIQEIIIIVCRVPSLLQTYIFLLIWIYIYLRYVICPWQCSFSISQGMLFIALKHFGRVRRRVQVVACLYLEACICPEIKCSLIWMSSKFVQCSMLFYRSKRIYLWKIHLLYCCVHYFLLDVTKVIRIASYGSSFKMNWNCFILNL